MKIKYIIGSILVIAGLIGGITLISSADSNSILALGIYATLFIPALGMFMILDR